MASSKYPPFPSWHRSKLRSRTVPDAASPTPASAPAAAGGGGNHKRPLHIKQEDCSGDTHWPESRRERIRAAGRTPVPTKAAGIHKSRLYPDPPKVKVEKKARPADTSSNDDRPLAKKAKFKAETRSDSHMMLYPDPSKVKVERKARPADTRSNDDRPLAKKAKVKAETRSDSHMMLYPDPPKVEKKTRPAETSSNYDRPLAKKAKVKAETRSDSHMMLADSISKLSGICDRIEDRRRKHMKELERMRAGFCKEMEAQKKQLLDQAHAKIESLREAGNDGAIDDFVERLSCWVRYEMFCSPVNFGFNSLH